MYDLLCNGVFTVGVTCEHSYAYNPALRPLRLLLSFSSLFLLLLLLLLLGVLLIHLRRGGGLRLRLRFLLTQRNAHLCGIQGT